MRTLGRAERRRLVKEQKRFEKPHSIASVRERPLDLYSAIVVVIEDRKLRERGGKRGDKTLRKMGR
jgi:hypothetical protein